MQEPRNSHGPCRAGDGFGYGAWGTHAIDTHHFTHWRLSINQIYHKRTICPCPCPSPSPSTNGGRESTILKILQHIEPRQELRVEAKHTRPNRYKCNQSSVLSATQWHHQHPHHHHHHPQLPAKGPCRASSAYQKTQTVESGKKINRSVPQFRVADKKGCWLEPVRGLWTMNERAELLRFAVELCSFIKPSQGATMWAATNHPPPGDFHQRCNPLRNYPH